MKLTIHDLFTEGYYRDISDLAERTDLSTNAIKFWLKKGDMIPEKRAQLVCDCALKPLQVWMLATRPHGGTGRYRTITEAKQKIKIAVRVADAKLSTWCLALGKIEDC